MWPRFMRACGGVGLRLLLSAYCTGNEAADEGRDDEDDCHFNNAGAQAGDGNQPGQHCDGEQESENERDRYDNGLH